MAEEVEERRKKTGRGGGRTQEKEESGRAVKEGKEEEEEEEEEKGEAEVEHAMEGGRRKVERRWCKAGGMGKGRVPDSNDGRTPPEG